MTVYRLRDRRPGLFSTGGYRPGWSKKGKVWNGLGPVRAHITMNRYYEDPEWIGHVEIVEYRLEEAEVKTHPIAAA